MSLLARYTRLRHKTNFLGHKTGLPIVLRDLGLQRLKQLIQPRRCKATAYNQPLSKGKLRRLDNFRANACISAHRPQGSTNAASNNTDAVKPFRIHPSQHAVDPCAILLASATAAVRKHARLLRNSTCDNLLLGVALRRRQLNLSYPDGQT